MNGKQNLIITVSKKLQLITQYQDFNQPHNNVCIDKIYVILNHII
jgi:hypothetical protein